MSIKCINKCFVLIECNSQANAHFYYECDIIYIRMKLNIYLEIIWDTASWAHIFIHCFDFIDATSWSCVLLRRDFIDMLPF